ncbi:MAG: hypothetical protein P1V97_14085 [Planctomycetota bacterium]|nr:hypothetical protein [Planctomycetota bacterium]
MALKEQILRLDRMLRSADLNEAEATDLEVFNHVDMDRLHAFGQYIADKVVHRFWGERFPATIRGIAFALGGHETPLAEVARQVMATPWFEKTIGEDVTGSALLGWLCSRRDDFPRWLIDMAGYEYLVGCALPRLAHNETRDLEMEKNLLPELQLIEPVNDSQSAPGKGVQLAKTLALVCFEYPVTELQEVLSCGGMIEAEVLPEPQAVLLAVDKDGLLELDAGYPAADLLQLCARPQALEQLKSVFPNFAVEELVEEFKNLTLLEAFN